jgi:hypothetical protein
MSLFQQVSDNKPYIPFFIFITLLQAFAKAAKRAIISMKPTRQMRWVRGGKTRKNNEKICGKILPHN